MPGDHTNSLGLDAGSRIDTLYIPHQIVDSVLIYGTPTVCASTSILASDFKFSRLTAWELCPSSSPRNVVPTLVNKSAEFVIGLDRDRDCGWYGLANCSAYRRRLGLIKAAKLGKQETMTAIADSRLVYRAVKPTTPPLVRVSMFRTRSKTIVMRPQQNTPVSPSFVIVRICKVLSIASGKAMTNEHTISAVA